MRLLEMPSNSAGVAMPVEQHEHVLAKTYQIEVDAATAGDGSICGDDQCAVIDLIAPGRPLAEALELLSLAGLGDAFVMLRRPRELSDGQRFRFEIARLMASAHTRSADDPPALIVIDEFAATLDRITARNLARNIRRWSDRSGVAFVVATTHEDLTDALAPDLLIRKNLDGSISSESRRRNLAHGVGEPETRRQREHADRQRHDRQRDLRPSPGGALNTALFDLSGTQSAALPVHLARARGVVGHDRLSVPNSSHTAVASADPADSADEFVIEPGSLADYRALAAFHYRSHHPGAATTVLRLVHRLQKHVSEASDSDSQTPTPTSETAPIGVLVRSLPHLSCAARDVALNGRYATLSPHERGIAVNREIRCISRVVIDPRFRGMGLAVRLVRHALEHPENPAILYTEALAAMGRVSPFFERAGMRRIDLAPECRPAHARLLDALHTVGLSAGDLSRDGGVTLLATLEPRRSGLLISEARRFLRATRRLPPTTLAAMTERELLATAAARLMLQPVYYLFAHQ